METGRHSKERGGGWVLTGKIKAPSFGGAAHRGQLPAAKRKGVKGKWCFCASGTSNYCTQRADHIQNHQIGILDECVLEVDSVTS